MQCNSRHADPGIFAIPLGSLPRRTIQSRMAHRGRPPNAAGLRVRQASKRGRPPSAARRARAHLNKWTPYRSTRIGSRAMLWACPRRKIPAGHSIFRKSFLSGFRAAAKPDRRRIAKSLGTRPAPQYRHRNKCVGGPNRVPDSLPGPGIRDAASRQRRWERTPLCSGCRHEEKARSIVDGIVPMP